MRAAPPLPHPTPLTPYAVDDDPTAAGAPTAGRGAEWSGTARRAWASLRVDGVGATVARSGRSLRHRWALRRARAGRS